MRLNIIHSIECPREMAMPMKVLSLFDGISGGQIALRELGIIPDAYYASEIDRFAIRQTQLNFPDTIQLGDIEKWREWNIEWKSINLILAGSPCQGFSCCGKRLAFDDPRSKLFFVFVDILNHVKKFNPDVKFLLENVMMKKAWIRIISEHVGILPVCINATLVSAQNRVRLYWTNIRTREDNLFRDLYSDIPQPQDKGIVLRDILEDEVDKKYYLSEAVLRRIELCHINYMPKIDPVKTGAITTRNNSCDMSLDRGTTFTSIDGKASTQRASTGTSIDPKRNYQYMQLNAKGNMRPNQDKVSRTIGASGNGTGNHPDIYSIYQFPRGYNKGGFHDAKSPTVSSNTWGQNNFVVQLNQAKESSSRQPYQQNRVYSINYKSPAAMSSMSCGSYAINAARIRRLTPTEVARLFTIPDWCIWHNKTSDTQKYKLLGNGWVIEVIKHILKYLNNKK